MDIVRFLAEHAPFDDLDPERLQDVAARGQIEFFAEGSAILRDGDDSSHTVYVARPAGSTSANSPLLHRWA